MTGAGAVHFHVWPWSYGVPKETCPCQPDSVVACTWRGSPLLSLPEGCSLVMEGGHEPFTAMSPVFHGQRGAVRLYQMPYGAASPFYARESGHGQIRLTVSGAPGQRGVYAFGQSVETWPREEAEESGQQAHETPLARLVRAWADEFDRLFGEADQDGYLPWMKVVSLIRHVEESTEPRMALIVHIAEKMVPRLGEIVWGARRVLARDRRLLPAGRLEELDAACLHWYIRQPGVTPAQKAAANRQSLLGITRRETFDTLENRVLKDFMRRCIVEGRTYLLFDCTDVQRHSSRRGQSVGVLKALCEELSLAPHLALVAPQKGMARPNYVLQNDARYKSVWELYLRLLKQDNEAESLWIWQNRTWDDAACLLLGAALVEIAHFSSARRSGMALGDVAGQARGQGEAAGMGTATGQFVLRELAASDAHIFGEPRQGQRLAPGCEPGPFVVYRKGGTAASGYLLELVHASQMAAHPVIRFFGQLGASRCLVFSPLFPEKEMTIVAVWGVHTAVLRQPPSALEMASSLAQALKDHEKRLNEQAKSPVRLLGLVLASRQEAGAEDERRGAATVLCFGAAPEDWSDGLSALERVLTDMLEKII